jgi:two-component system chemotaxis response regulator CheB
MSASIRVLLADDSAVVRRLLKETFSSHPDIEVVATAPNGQIMLSQIDSARPDVVVLDVEMPVMDGKRTSASVVAIGASTGGPNALATVLSGLPARLAVPVLIVQHMPAVFTAMLAERLDKTCPLRVREAHDGAVVEAGDVWIAPGDFHMTVIQRDGQVVLKTSQAAAENSCRPSVDVLFRSVVDVYGERTLGVILTGMGKDGFAGCRRISQAGGYVVAQDEESSVVWGMPRVVAEAGVANRVRPLSRIAADITTGVRVAGSTPTLAAGAAR